MNRETIKAIVDSKPEEADISEWIALKLQELKNVCDEVVAARWAEMDALATYEKFRESCRERIAKVQSACPHYTFTFYSDPAGGSDSSLICDVCSKDVSHARRRPSKHT